MGRSRPPGLRRVRLLPSLLALVFLAPFLVGGAAAANQTETAAPSGTPTAVDLLARASRRLAETQSVHFRLDVEGETFVDEGEEIRLVEAEGDLQRPDRVATTFKAEVFTRIITLNLITIGDQTWTTNILTGDWEIAPPEFAYRPAVLFDNQEGIGPVMGRVQDVELRGEEEIDGRPAHHVVARVDESVIGPLTYETMSGSPITVDLWIDRESDDLLRARLAEPPGVSDDPATWTLDLSEHGEQVAIEAPV